MKIDRLIGILSILLQKDAVTAPYLAEQFEVSRRTINRDIEDLCKAGIPIVTRQGANGGISIMENYKVDRTLLTNTEMQDILAGLRSLDSINGTNRYGQLMEKLTVGSSDFMTGNQSVLIDLSSWYKDSLAPKIELIRSAIDSDMELHFLYFSPKGETQRNIEPYYLIFRWSSWYLWGWCKTREDYRLFKLNRMDKVHLSGHKFNKRAVPFPDLSNERIFPGGIKVKALFESDCKWRLVEEFGVECFEEQSDGKLLFHADYTDKENLITWLMTFRDQAALLEPEDIREEIQSVLRNMLKEYGEINKELSVPKPKKARKRQHGV
ncbi:helix-turn-helix transcriptional regulator [Faecalicatena contorta]|uniref:Predicted DNA-binding transcriptional regulator YafY, contains an HTH and WYL domains n=1 Tax=Faecalicatena contorta TaxID=39482 RepID=A0A315ZXI2_9FIRM|nr:YafY family protein [Faecalicatena contorta]PWJ49234.1 putative DNA-binding transcriptional regulator YafY [Faecalicatena contorta]SUQ14939.1 Predicted DNA-binding transcriptional regulator YafY, contains an HTH and WYL domains [Faecalicatena contorta]